MCLPHRTSKAIKAVVVHQAVQRAEALLSDGALPVSTVSETCSHQPFLRKGGEFSVPGKGQIRHVGGRTVRAFRRRGRHMTAIPVPPELTVVPGGTRSQPLQLSYPCLDSAREH